MKQRKCEKCNNTTRQEDGICVICKLGLSQMSSELKEMMKKPNKRMKAA